MPELPEVQTISSDLNEIVGGKVITNVSVNYARIVEGDSARFIDLLTGAWITGVERMGKWVKFRLDGPTEAAVMLAHLKMTGQFHLGSWPGRGLWQKHDHVAFKLKGMTGDADTLFYKDIRKFGRLRAFTKAEFEDFAVELGLGPDPLLIDPLEFHRRLTCRKGRLKSVLLDQSVVAGLGNIYVDECLFAAKLSPLEDPAWLTMSDADRLLKEIKRILSASIKARGSTTSNYQGLKGGGSFQNLHKVYKHSGEPCPVCGCLIERSVVGGRSTHHCPRCQARRIAFEAELPEKGGHSEAAGQAGKKTKKSGKK